MATKTPHFASKSQVRKAASLAQAAQVALVLNL